MDKLESMEMCKLTRFEVFFVQISVHFFYQFPTELGCKRFYNFAKAPAIPNSSKEYCARKSK